MADCTETTVEIGNCKITIAIFSVSNTTGNIGISIIRFQDLMC